MKAKRFYRLRDMYKKILKVLFFTCFSLILFSSVLGFASTDNALADSFYYTGDTNIESNSAGSTLYQIEGWQDTEGGSHYIYHYKPTSPYIFED